MRVETTPAWRSKACPAKSTKQQHFQGSFDLLVALTSSRASSIRIPRTYPPREAAVLIRSPVETLTPTKPSTETLETPPLISCGEQRTAWVNHLLLRREAEARKQASCRSSMSGAEKAGAAPGGKSSGSQREQEGADGSDAEPSGSRRGAPQVPHHDIPRRPRQPRPVAVAAPAALLLAATVCVSRRNR